MILIDQPCVGERDGRAILSASFTSDTANGTLWFAVDAALGRHFDSAAIDPFVVALLPLSLRTGEAIQAAGTLSARLLFDLTTQLGPLVGQLGIGVPFARITAARAVEYPTAAPGAAVATGFSGGIDSFCILSDHLGDAAPLGHRVTHLVCNNVGAFGHDGTATFHARLPLLHETARELGLSLLAVDSNLAEVLGLPSFPRDHEFRNVAAVLALQSLVGTYLYASAYRFADCFERRSDICFAHWDPLILPLLSTERLRVVPVGSQYSRVEKTARIASFRPAHRHLNVCVRDRSVRNCSTCWKCVRTMLTLELLGRLQDFHEVFDLQVYARVRSHFIVEMLRSEDPLWREICALARARHYRVPPVLRLAAIMPPAVLRTARRTLPRGFKQAIARR